MTDRPPTAAQWDAAVTTGLLRLTVGAALLRWRGPLARLSGADADDRLIPLVFGYFGVRDMTLGLAALSATRPGRDVARQVTWQGIADTVDGGLIAGLIATGRLPRARGGGMVALAAGSAAMEYAGAARLRRERG